MSRFSFFGDQKHRVFNYKPMYYDEEKEERRRLFGNVDGSNEADTAEGKEHVPGAYIRGAFRDGNYARRRGGSRAQSFIGIVGLVLVFIVLLYFTKFFSLL